MSLDIDRVRWHTAVQIIEESGPVGGRSLDRRTRMDGYIA